MPSLGFSISLPRNTSGGRWRADLQRQQLSGFQKIRAVLWRRSLRLYESWALRAESWYRPLIRSVNHRFSGLDCDSPGRVTQDALVFGETSPLTTVTLLKLVEPIVAEGTKHFVDLGCGRGVTCLVAASVGWESSGFEHEENWMQAARRVAGDLQLEVNFLAGDFLEQDWPTQGVFYVVGTAFDDQLLAEIMERIPKDSPIIACDWLVDSSGRELLWEGSLPVEWGQAYFRLYSGEDGA